jgi:hypothetical protein
LRPLGKRAWALAGGIVALAFALFAGYRIGNGSYAEAAVLAAVPLALLLAQSEWSLVAAALVAAYLGPGVQYLLGAGSQVLVSYIPKALVVALFFAVLLRLSKTQRQAHIFPILIVWLVLLLVSAFVHGFNALSAQAFVGFAIAPLAFMVVSNASPSRRGMKGVIATLAAMLVLQLGFVLLQSVGGLAPSIDQVSGTLGRSATTFLGVLMAAVFAVATVRLFAGYRRWAIAAVLCASVVMILSEAKAGFLLAGIGTVVGLAALAWRRRSTRLAIASLLVGLVPVAVLYFYYYFVDAGRADAGGTFAFLTSPSQMVAYLFSSSARGQAGRLGGLSLVFAQSPTLADLALGKGVGALSTSSVVGTVDASALQLQATFGWATSAGRMLIEAGLLGLVSFIVAAADAARRAAVAVWNGGSRHADWLGASACALAAVFIAGGFYTSAWTFDATGFSYWILLGMLVSASALLSGDYDG